MPETNNHEMVVLLIARLKKERENKNNNATFNDALDEAINKLKNLKKFF